MTYIGENWVVWHTLENSGLCDIHWKKLGCVTYIILWWTLWRKLWNFSVPLSWHTMIINWTNFRLTKNEKFSEISGSQLENDDRRCVSVCSSTSLVECESIFEWITHMSLLFPSIRLLVHSSVELYFFGVYGWLYCSCPNTWFAFFIAPAHLHTTWVAVYPAIFSSFTCIWHCWHWKKALPFQMNYSLHKKIEEIGWDIKKAHLMGKSVFSYRALCFCAGLSDFVRREPGMLCQKNY